MTDPVFNDPVFEDPLEQAPPPQADVLEPIFDDEEPATVVPAAKPIPGPGLGESLAWTVGTLVIHIVGASIIAIAIFATEFSQQNIQLDNPEALQEKLRDSEFLESLQKEHLLELLAGEQLIFLVCVVLFGWLRLRRKPVNSLPLQMPPWSHIGLSCLWILPLALTCAQLGVFVQMGFERLIELYPHLESLNPETTMETVRGLTETVSAWQLVLWIAVLPAISEEIVFRGVIGRGLVARYGMWVGVGITSVLFAAVHLHPVHAIALLPLAVAMHVAYLASRSFLIPILIHFLNNSFAVVSMYADPAAAPEEVTDASGVLPWYVTLAAVVCSLVIGRVFWRSRVEIREAGGADWQPGYATADTPLSSEGFSRERQSSPLTHSILCAVSVIALIATFVIWDQMGEN